ncbi:MAG: NAD(P)-dependent oxidoreductase [Alphaproteobacteria bacterium]
MLLVTGGNGFVMSNLVRLWLETDARARVVVADAWAPDAVWQRFVAPLRDRVMVVTGDVTDPAWWSSCPELGAVTMIAHGAAVTPGVGPREKEQARTTVAVNVMGTVNVLEWARTRSGLTRFLHVSTGSVYGDEGPDGPLPEDGWEARTPRGLYAITKRAGELIARRYATLFGVPVVTVRLASVYGPMDRATPARRVVCLPNRLVHLALAGGEARVNTLDAVGDYIHAGDVAAAMVALLRAGRLDHDLYNVAYGEPATMAEVLGHVVAAVPGFRWRVTAKDEANVIEDASRKRGAWGAYDNSRLRALGWSPRQLRTAIADYAAWVREYETVRSRPSNEL